MTIILADKLYVPIDMVPKRKVLAHYQTHLYKEKVCARCEERDMRFSYACMECPAHLRKVVLWGQTTIKGRKYWMLPGGDPQQVGTNLGIDVSGLKNIRSDVPMRCRWKFSGELRQGETVNDVKTVNQKRLVRPFLKDPNGMLIAKTRSGKAVMAIYIAIKNGQRTLILAHKDRLLKQFMMRLRELTNLEQLEAKGRRPAGIVKTDKDFDEIEDIVLCNYQKFIHPETGVARLNKFAKDRFGLVMIDESDLVAASAFSIVAAGINSDRIGFTASKERKDGAEFIAYAVMGPIRAEGENVKLIPRFELVETGLKPRTDFKNFTNAVRWLSEHEERNKQIVRLVFSILREDPRRNILIPVMLVDHVQELTKLLNRQAAVNNYKRGENWNETRFAVPYWGGNKNQHDQLLTYVEKGKGTRVTVAMRSMVTRGTDIPAWTDLIYSFLFSNPPQCDQLLSRVCTPGPNKPEPRIHTFVDNMGLSYGCFRTSFLKTMVPDKYLMDAQTRKRAYELVGQKSKGNSARQDSSLIGLWE